MSSADSTVIRPRWEWRTFGTHFGVAEDAFAALTPTDVAESDELYLLAAGGDTVKIRADLLDIKVLREVDAAGLERWEPILKAPFPLSRAHVGQVGASLKLVLPAPSRDEYTLDQLLGELLEPTGAVRAVPVHKRRVRYTVGGCSSELSDVVADGRTTRTIAIESEDAAAVVKAVASVGLDGFVNTSYPRGLTALLDGLAARFAIIDVGTNSVKFHLGERSTEGTWQTVMDRAEVTRLGEGVGEHGEIAPGALDRTAAAMSGMADEARMNGAIVILAVGTAGLRAAGNQEAVLAELQARTGITVRVISGEDEGRLAHLAAVEWLDRPPGSVVVFDTGGGSTQFSFGHGTHVEERFSVPVGAVRYTERFGLGGEVAPAVLDEARAAIGDDLARIDDRPAPDALVAMGGAVTNIAAVMHGLATYDPDIIQGTVIDRDEIDRQIELYRSRDVAGRRQIAGLQSQRADVILAGACIVRAVMDKLGQSTLTVSDRGLRHGVLIERFGR